MPRPMMHRNLGPALQALWPSLVMYARTWTAAEEAEDVVQQAYVRLLSTDRTPADPRSWLFRCVRNEAISWRRTWRRRLRREHAAARDERAFVTTVDTRLDARRAEQALTSLPPLQREVVVLRIWSGLTFAEASAVMNVPISTLHDRFRQALSTLREELEPTCPTSM